MSFRYQIKTDVQFPEQSAVSKVQSESVLFDILTEDITDNASYCTALIEKMLSLPYAQLPGFFAHHCNLISDPIKWLNKTEKLIYINEKAFSSSDNHGRMIKCYTIIESKRKEIELVKISLYSISQYNVQYGRALSSQNLTWTSSKTSLVELIYALYQQGVFDNGNADVKQIAKFFEATFNIDLGDFYHTFLEIHSRKINRTKFIDSLREGLIRKMDELDEK